MITVIREFLQDTGRVLYLKSDKVNRKGERSGPCGAPMVQRSMLEASHTHSPAVTPQQVDEDQSLPKVTRLEATGGGGILKNQTYKKREI